MKFIYNFLDKKDFKKLNTKLDKPLFTVVFL